MEVEISFYGNLSHLVGTRVKTVTVEGTAPTVAELRLAIAEQLPVVASYLEHTAVGSGVVLLADDDTLEPGARVSLLPPVTGG